MLTVLTDASSGEELAATLDEICREGARRMLAAALELEVDDYLTALRQILRYIGVSTGNMEEGPFRCDANVSVREIGGPLGAKVEVKNMNSFRAVERALRFEQNVR